MVESRRWSRLREAEAVQPSTEESRGRAEALADELRRLHPFSSDPAGLRLGGVVYDRDHATFRSAARARYPDEGDERHPGELEVLVCGEQGRVHETLFVAEVRPLHPAQSSFTGRRTSENCTKPAGFDVFLRGS